MPEPICSAAPSPPPATLTLEPVLITGDASKNDPVPIGEIARSCLAKLDGAALAVLVAPANPAIAALVAFKAGLELGECAAYTTNRVAEEKSLERKLEQCAAMGGSPLGEVRGDLSCAIPVRNE